MVKFTEKVSMKLFFAALAFAAALLYSLLKKPYPVHNSGAILISGASTGIGNHAAVTLANTNKQFVVYAGVRKEKDFKAILDLKLPNLLPILLDVTDELSVQKAISVIKESGQPLIALVNNAGIHRSSFLEYHAISDLKYIFETNYFGMARLTQVSLPLLRESKGRIVQISSVAGKISTVLSGGYSSSKFAMESFSDALRREVDHFGISVSIVEPAYVKTNIFESSKEASKEIIDTQLSDKDRDNMKVLYSHLFSEEKINKILKSFEQAAEPTVTSEAIVHAITSKNPQTRYVVAVVGAIPAWVLTNLAWLLTDRALDVLTKYF